MGQIRGFSRSDLAPNALKSDLKKPRICPIGVNLTHLGAKPTIPVNEYHSATITNIIVYLDFKNILHKATSYTEVSAVIK